MSGSSSQLEDLKRQLKELKELMDYATQLLARVAESSEQFQATVRESRTLWDRTAAQRRWSPT